MRYAIVTVATPDRLGFLIATSEAIARQTVPCRHYVVQIGPGQDTRASAPDAIHVRLPVDSSHSMLAAGIGMQLALNEKADVVAAIAAGDMVEPRCIELVAREFERTQADIVELKNPARPSSELGVLFFTGHAAFIPGIRGQISPQLEAAFREILDQVVGRQGLRTVRLDLPLVVTRRNGDGRSEKAGLAGEEAVRQLYQQTGILLRPVAQPAAGRVDRVAVVTPYHDEPVEMLRRCHDSVTRQRHEVKHILVADGHAISEIDKWDAVHLILPAAHCDNGNTARGIGGMVAFALGYDAVAYLDPGSWYVEEHIQSMLSAQQRDGARVVCTWRTIVLPDGTRLEHIDPADRNKTQVDTSSFLITREAAFLAKYWAQMPQGLGPLCNRIFLAIASETVKPISWTEQQTVYFESNDARHYKMANRTPEKPGRDIPKEPSKEYDPIEFRGRTGWTLSLEKKQPLPAINPLARDKAAATAAIYQGYRLQALGLRDTSVYGAPADMPTSPDICDVKLIAYYLPQFHPIPENDAWWGKGFTEWTNVTKAVPGFVGHDQPKLPGELGFYDLRLVDTLRRQAELAKFYGIAAFCFHFYWFNGKRLLELPLQNFFDNRDINIQFCFCWANENWTRRWDGADQHVLIGQTHSPEDDIAFIRYLGRYFDDPRYLRIGGKPVLSVYRPAILPDAAATTARWRAEAMKMGLPGLYLIATTAFGFVNHESLGFDALSEFPPHWARKVGPRMRTDLDFLAERYPAKVYDYRDYIRSKAGEPVGKGRVWPGVMPAWDNCARSPKAGHVFHGSTPRLFYEWLKSSIDRARANPAEERFVVINAWNEWAEGAYLEPDRRSGYGYLTACASAISDQGAADAAAAAIFRSSREAFRAGKRLASCAHLYDSSAAESLRDDLRSFDDLDLYLTVPRHTPPDAAQRLLDLFPRAFIQEVENRGRDVLPFLRVLHAARRGNHDFICKMHAGGSFHNGTAELAADETLRSLLSERLRRQLQAAAKSNRVGVVVPKGSPASRSAGESVPRISQYTANLMAELKLTAAPDGGLASPSMFWFRPAAISKLVDAVDLDQFEPELGQTEGTLALGLQRMWIAAAQSAAFEVQQAAA